MALGELRPDPVARRLLPFTFLILGMAILVSRIPMDLLTNFWAEDGNVFYAQAYNLGAFHALVLPRTGYLQTFPRLEAILAIHLPLSKGPLLATLAALIFDVLPGAFFLTDRFQGLVPSRPLRLLIALVSVILPNSFELNGNLANVQWHLALLGFLIVVAPRARSVWGMGLDFAGLVVAGLSGPFCFPLVVIAFVRWLSTRPAGGGRLAVLATTALVQATVLVANFREQRQGDVWLMLRNARLNDLVGALDRPLLTTLLGTDLYQQVIDSRTWHRSIWSAVLILLLGLIAVAYSAWRGPAVLRLLQFLAVAVLGMTLVSAAPLNSWHDLLGGGGGARYFYIPALVWVVTLIWITVAAHRWMIRFAGLLLLVPILVFAVPHDWRYPSMPPTGFQAAAQRFERAPAGTTMSIPIEISPIWTMELRKR